MEHLEMAVGEAEQREAAARAAAEKAEDRVRELEQQARAVARQGEEDGASAAVEHMEASLIRMSDILRRKDTETESLKRTVNAECSERVRLLALVQQLQGSGAPAAASQGRSCGAVSAGNAPPSSADATMQAMREDPAARLQAAVSSGAVSSGSVSNAENKWVQRKPAQRRNLHPR